MKFGIAFANVMGFTDGPGAVGLGTAAEAAGFESLWTIEHVVYPERYESTYPYDPSGRMTANADTPMPDPLIWLSFVAAATSHIRLATGILIVPQRNPVVLAKEVATLDAMSGGRVTLGIGVGWLEEEFDALGIPFANRGGRTDEYVAAMRTLWDGNKVSFSGEFVDFDEISSSPKPTNGHVPIVIGGHSSAAARRAGRIGDGFFPAKGDLAELFDIVRQTAADEGRDPSAIELTAGHPGLMGDDPQSAVAELTDLGVSRTIVPSFMFALAPDPETAIATFGEDVIAGA